MELTEEQRQALYKCARQAGDIGDSRLRSFSGADQADSEADFCERRVYVAVSQGVELDAALATEDLRWREYAKGQAKEVSDAPKIKRGPSSGHSVISHRWVDPERFASKARHIRFMVQRSLEV